MKAIALFLATLGILVSVPTLAAKKRYFARVNGSNRVTSVIVADQAFIDTGAVGNPANWFETSRDGSVTKNFAGVGYTYDRVTGQFVPPRPFLSWSLDADVKWQPPLAYPKDGKVYLWNEALLTWDEDKK